MSFVHLHTHSHYSLLDGLSKIDELIDLAKAYQMPALALTDHGVMYGIVEFYQKAKKAGLKPIIGVEAYVAKNGRLNKRPKIDERPYHLILLAKNYEGYKNLMKLTTLAHLEGYYYKPRLDHELLEKYSQGIIATSACLASETSRHIMSDDVNGAREAIARYQKIFGSENFYLEVQHHPNIPEQIKVNERIYQLADELKVPLVATNDSHYPKKEDAFAQDVMLCIQTKKTLDDKDRMSYLHEDFSFKSPEQMKRDFAAHPQAIENTLALADRCQVDLEFGKIQLPSFEVPQGKTPDEYLRDLCLQGLSERYGQNPVEPKTMERLDYELSVIQKTGYASYFLIVSDFIVWAKNNKIVVGPGRGSAAGSLVAYLTKITDIDPLAYNLLFERFLNPERVSMPDIDTDFADTRRDEVLKYVSDKYGHDHVAQIITFGTMAARASIRDVGRVMGLPYNYCDTAAKLIPMHMTLDEAIEVVPELKQIMNEPQGKKLLETAKRVEGCVRHASTHACGVVITKDETDGYTPRQKGTQSEDSIMTQYEMHAIEELGLLKMDFLGLTNLTVIENTLEILKKARGIDLDLVTLPLNDSKAYALLQRGETTGVFQLESSGMKRYLKMLKPTEFEDIIAMVSLYRPGPMEFIPDYIDGKHKRRRVTYLDPQLKPILQKTYGIAVYQEQIMEISRQLAGFTYGEADVLRKAVGKKIASLLNEQEQKMIDGMVKHGIKPAVAKAIWEFILPFARYGFNRSHAACYAMIAYRTAYLKANYPAEFMASLLTADQDNIDRIAIEVAECRTMGLEVLPPDINESFSTFTVVYDTQEMIASKSSHTIRFGLEAVKNLGENIAREIIRERKANGPYLSLEQFLSRIKVRDLNKKSLEALIKSGALDKFGERNQMIYNIEKILHFVHQLHEEALSQQSSLFGMLEQPGTLPKLVLDTTEPASDKLKLTWEKELLGLYLTSHPLHEIAGALEGQTLTSLDDVSKQLPHLRSRGLKVVGVVTSVKKIITKKGENMLFAKIEDTVAASEVLVFPSILKETAPVWQEDTVIMMHCKLSDKDGEAKLICNKVKEITKDTVLEISKEFDSIPEQSHGSGYGQYRGYARSRRERSEPVSYTASSIDGTLCIALPQSVEYKKISQLKDLLRSHPGTYQVHLIVKNGSHRDKKIVTSYKVSTDAALQDGIRELLGGESIRLESGTAA